MAESSPQLLKYACRFCARRFKRPDHVQRHERRHTKETPYPCFCGQAFSRHDLLTRHQKLSHQMEPVKRRKLQADAATGHDATSLTEAALPRDENTIAQWIGPVAESSAEISLRDSSIFSSHPVASVATEGMTMNGDLSLHAPDFGLPHFDMNNYLSNGDFWTTDLDFATPAMFRSNNTVGHTLSPMPEPVAYSPSGCSTSHASEQHQQIDASGEVIGEAQLASRVGSPLPSLRTLTSLDSPVGAPTVPARTAPIPCWKVSQTAYERLQGLLRPRIHLIDPSFKLPSRHTMSHYLERCINSLYRHQPCVHIPTFRPESSPLALILSMCAVGAQLRFESESGVAFFHASKACLMADLHSAHRKTVVSRLMTLDRQGASQDANSPASPVPNASPASPSDSDVYGSRIQNMQALLTLMSFGSWGPRALLAETLTLQSMLCMLAREEGLGYEPDDTVGTGPSNDAWQRWTAAESSRRIKTIAYYFTGLQSLAYGMPPPILTAELRCNTPCSAHEWAAPDSVRWNQMRKQKNSIKSTPFQPAFEELFNPSDTTRNSGGNDRPNAHRPISAMGLYALIFGVLQRIFYLRQCRPSSRVEGTREACCSTALANPDFNEIVMALHRWQSQWESCPESTIEPEASAGPISFNAIACLRMAWIRIYADIGPCRNLATRDASVIAGVFHTSPKLDRHPMLTPIILQAIHAMSVPVRLGVKFVSRSQIMFWSVNQSLCILECAIILHRWFQALADTLSTEALTKQELKLLGMLTDVVIESDLIDDEDLDVLDTTQGEDDPPSDRGNAQTSASTRNHLGMSVATVTNASWPQKSRIQALSRATAQVWAEIFSNSHVFELVTTIGKTLSIYAESMKRKAS